MSIRSQRGRMRWHLSPTRTFVTVNMCNSIRREHHRIINTALNSLFFITTTVEAHSPHAPHTPQQTSP